MVRGQQRGKARLLPDKSGKPARQTIKRAIRKAGLLRRTGRRVRNRMDGPRTRGGRGNHSELRGVPRKYRGAAMSAEIIQFSTAARPGRSATDKQVLTPRQRRREGKPELPPPATETAKNSRIRIVRRDAWWHADRVADYWRTRLDWHGALETAQRYGIADSASFPSAENETGLGWSTNGARRLRRSCLPQRPILARSPGSARNSRAVIFLTCPSKKNGLNGRSPMTSRSLRHTRREPRGARHEAPASIGKEAALTTRARAQVRAFPLTAD